MAENLIVFGGSKEEEYRCLLPQLKNLIEGEPDMTANLANVAAALAETFHHLWIGFYLVKPAVKAPRYGAVPTEELVLGPFQGPIACTRIGKGRGVCGTAWAEARTQVVPDVDQFPGHIACNSRSQSEIVVPLLTAEGDVWGVLDIDSEFFQTFDAVDVRYLEELCELLSQSLIKSCCCNEEE